MPWPVKDLITVRLEFVNLALQPDANIRQLCRRFEISPTAGYKWIARFKTLSAEGLTDQSRRPHHSPSQTTAGVEQELIALRKKHPAWGARKLRRRLQDLGHTSLPATSTITGILHRHGLIDPLLSQASTPFERFERSQPNELWQIDFKGHFPLKNGRCHPLGGLDDHSRYNVLLEACTNQQEHTVQNRLAGAFRRHGLPDAILWDNGSPWGGGQSDYSTLDVWLMRLGIKVYHGRPYHPQTQGKEERFHRTLKAEVLQQGGWQDCRHVQEAFDRWRPIYNTQRPHDMLDLDTPVSRYRPSQRSYPESLPPVEYDSSVEVRRVDAAGWISYRGQDWKIGRAFTGQDVGLRPGSTDGILEVIYLTQRIKELDLRQDLTQPASKTL
ncbi:MAG TPA: IS481 family transposase [Verrucomicrobiae bacterium]|jgi:transposase InsO family protein|nr:IS481 family transposase [Verrucomicrobiae bacterium]